MNTEKMLSVIIITYNEEKNIKRCLESVKWANEIIVIDSGSTDNTVKICREYTDKITVTDWPGYGKQKNRALEKASNPWVLSLDADEKVSEALKKDILSAILNDEIHAYTVPIQLVFYGQQIKYANGSSKNVRLFQRTHACFSDKDIHEGVLVSGSTRALHSPLWHYSFQSIDDILSKMNRYSTANAIHHAKRGAKTGALKALLHGGWMFFRVYFLNLGFLDGRAGLVLAISFAEGSYYRYMKQLFLNQEQSIS